MWISFLLKLSLSVFGCCFADDPETKGSSSTVAADQSAHKDQKPPGNRLMSQVSTALYNEEEEHAFDRQLVRGISAEELGLTGYQKSTLKIDDSVPGSDQHLHQVNSGSYEKGENARVPGANVGASGALASRRRRFRSLHLRQSEKGITLSNREALVLFKDSRPLDIQSGLIKNLGECVKGITRVPSITAQEAILIAAQFEGIQVEDPEKVLSLEPKIPPSATDLSRVTTFGSIDGITDQDVRCTLVWVKNEKNNLYSRRRMEMSTALKEGEQESTMRSFLRRQLTAAGKRSNSSESSKDCGVYLAWECVVEFDSWNAIFFDINAHPVIRGNSVKDAILVRSNLVRSVTFHGVLEQPRQAPCATCTSYNDVLYGEYDPYDHQILLDNVVDPESIEASPDGWVDDILSPFTVGNNVRAYHDLFELNKGMPISLTTDHRSLVLNNETNVDSPLFVSAAVTNLFYWTNYAHDILYHYGFDEASGNFQVDNFGRGGVGGDSANVEAMDGSGTCNANFYTPPDGESPRMQMYLCDDNRASSFDTGVIVHEYCHGLSDRLVGGPTKIGCLSNIEQAGEGFSDFCSLFLTVSKLGDEQSITRTRGAYIYGKKFGSRLVPYSPDWSINSYTFGKMKTLKDSEHKIGFFFATCLWDLYLAMVERHGYESDRFNVEGGGNTKVFHLFVQSLKNQRCEPNQVDSRDALLVADQQLFNGEHQCLIWGVFARRGLGLHAAKGFYEDFNVPDECDDLRCEQFWDTANPANTSSLPTRHVMYKTNRCQDEKLHESLIPWRDENGFNCGWYAVNKDKCPDNHSTNITTASAAYACCACGGGTIDGQPYCEDIVEEKPIIPWHDQDGYSCEAMSSTDDCNFSGELNANFGYSAFEACCTCGGGEQVGNETCADILLHVEELEWFDRQNKKCSWYERDPATYCNSFGNVASFFGDTAKDACCVCNGGSGTGVDCVDRTVNSAEVDYFDNDGYGCSWYASDPGHRCDVFGGTESRNIFLVTPQEACCACEGGNNDVEKIVLDSCEDILNAEGPGDGNGDGNGVDPSTPTEPIVTVVDELANFASDLNGWQCSGGTGRNPGCRRYFSGGNNSVRLRGAPVGSSAMGKLTKTLSIPNDSAACKRLQVIFSFAMTGISDSTEHLFVETSIIDGSFASTTTTRSADAIRSTSTVRDGAAIRKKVRPRPGLGGGFGGVGGNEVSTVLPSSAESWTTQNGWATNGVSPGDVGTSDDALVTMDIDATNMIGQDVSFRFYMEVAELDGSFYYTFVDNIKVQCVG